MTNAAINTAFLAAIAPAAKKEILQHIASHYGVSAGDIYEELTGEDAENVLDYMTGSARSAAHVLYQRHGFKL